MSKADYSFEQGNYTLLSVDPVGVIDGVGEPADWNTIAKFQSQAAYAIQAGMDMSVIVDEASEDKLGIIRLTKPTSCLRGTATRPLKGWQGGRRNSWSQARGDPGSPLDVGIDFVTSGTASVHKGTDGHFIQLATSAVLNGTAAVGANTGNQFAHGTEYGNSLYWRLKTGASIATMRLLIGWQGATGTPQFGNSDDSDHSLYFLYNPATSANWLCRSRSGTTTTSVNSGIAVAVDTIYQFLIEVPDGGGNPSYYIWNNDGTLLFSTTISTNLPTSPTNGMYARCELFTLEAVSKSIRFGKCEMQAQ